MKTKDKIVNEQHDCNHHSSDLPIHEKFGGIETMLVVVSYDILTKSLLLQYHLEISV